MTVTWKLKCKHGGKCESRDHTVIRKGLKHNKGSSSSPVENYLENGLLPDGKLLEANTVAEDPQKCKVNSLRSHG